MTTIAETRTEQQYLTSAKEQLAQVVAAHDAEHARLAEPIERGSDKWVELVRRLIDTGRATTLQLAPMSPEWAGELYADWKAGTGPMWPFATPSWNVASPVYESNTMNGDPVVDFTAAEHAAIVDGKEIGSAVVRRQDLLNIEDDMVVPGPLVVDLWVGGNRVETSLTSYAETCALSSALLAAAGDYHAIERDESRPQGPAQWPLRHFRDNEEIPLYAGDYIALDEAAAAAGKTRLELTYDEVMEIIFNCRHELGQKELPSERPGWNTTLADDHGDPDDPNNRDVKILIYGNGHASVEVERVYTSNPWIVYVDASSEGETDSRTAREFAAALVRAADLADELNAENPKTVSA
ncbi:hypothetical protein B7R21_06470 [Subtercola boreus]|uniref:Uncharacterized protein n=1 Tax=Subtercola boreus TaxID=120213 RepID=A0A3E0VY29_9MICO|nr:hypothetical protein [Subtercola boreus]RFA14238.1 hypothetical protein B7R21_06470 [Subtercola boreus]